ncbi:hypothetical protein SAY86_008934 [Trapa natans]|uniref:Uncharacterized protein n=1 Tax=Trapa natans TaxID=22666 RepID=A0AAN7KAD3_TRANT|nr:hypothetical protein SAY86_008934 [Trapa natans]
MATGSEFGSRKKERNIVTWTPQVGVFFLHRTCLATVSMEISVDDWKWVSFFLWIQEDDVLRKQVTVHGTDKYEQPSFYSVILPPGFVIRKKKKRFGPEKVTFITSFSFSFQFSWSIIASKFKDKTTRQCRRRWYTYLNSDFKRGGWSAEEDMLLCEAQKIFGNRWTEIAKVVSGRTDNAVKNRFTTLCKKRAKFDALEKENNASCRNSNGKNVIPCKNSILKGTAEHAAMTKRLRMVHSGDGSPQDDRLLRPPLAALAQNSNPKSGGKDCNSDDKDAKVGEIFMRKDPRFALLMQQAELLSSLAQKIDAERTGHSVEDAWKVLQDFLNHKKDGDIFECCSSEISIHLQNLKGEVAGTAGSNGGSQSSWRRPVLCEDSPPSSECSTGSTILLDTAPDEKEETEAEDKPNKNKLHTDTGDINGVQEHKKSLSTEIINEQESIQHSCDEQMNAEPETSAPMGNEFGSPLRVTPVFRSLAAGIPSPKFSESERNFLMKTLGIETPSTSTSTNLVDPPSCKRALLPSL